MNQEYIKKNVEQLQDISKNPQKFFTDIQEKNVAFAQEVKTLLEHAPQETSAYIQEQQQKLQEFNSELISLFSKQPVDWQAIGTSWFNYQTEQFNSYLEKTREQNEKFQHLVSQYAQDTPIEHVVNETQAQVKKATNRVARTAKSAR